MNNTSVMNNCRILAEGRYVSNDTRATHLNNNDLIIGSSGSGKTGGYVIPNILACDTSIVVADTKCNLCKKLGSALKAKGYEIKVIDFVNPKNSASYNPLKYIRRNRRTGVYNQQDIMSIANTLLPIYDTEDTFWVVSARTVIACIISYVLEAFDEKEKNFGAVAEVYRAIAGGVECAEPNSRNYFISFLENWRIDHPDSFAVKKYDNFKGNLCADKCWSSILQFVTTALDIFDFSEIQHMFNGPDPINFTELGKKKCAVFLNVSDTDRTLDTLVNIFYTQLFQCLCKCADNSPEGRLDVPVRVFLDDFATNVYIPDFDKLISVIRSREICVSIILQSLSQLDGIYNNAQSLTILNNCDHVIYLGGSDLRTADYIASRMCRSLESVLCLPCEDVLLLTRGKKGEQVARVKPYACLVNEGGDNSAE
ncbi:MAG: type IV secretory system conjugative DNA transfer family protein [Ruminiclostridium sp.]|nr:type IV secretory system conjugative DNA transfer family protein [Ruminiclostridium sp.]